MSPGLNSEIEVTIVSARGVVEAVDIRPRMRPAVIRLVAGKDVDVLIGVLPRLFALCSQAHVLACRTAIAAARDEVVDGSGGGSRIAPLQSAPASASGPVPASASGPVPASASGPPHVAVVREWVGELLRGLHVAGLLSADGASLRQAMRILAACGGEGGADAARQLEGALAALGISLAEGIAVPGSALAQAVVDLEALAPVGGGAASLLSPDDDDDVVAALFARGASFAAVPDLDGRVPETGAFARAGLAGGGLSEPGRVGSSPIASSPSAMMRMKARIAEIALLSAWLAGGNHDSFPLPGMVKSFRPAKGRGAAAVECARGRLYHAIELGAQGEIAAFEFLAPTEWNFHPRGALARALIGMTLHGGEGRRSVEAQVHSLDPCVGFQLNFSEPVHA